MDHVVVSQLAVSVARGQQGHQGQFGLWRQGARRNMEICKVGINRLGIMLAYTVLHGKGLIQSASIFPSSFIISVPPPLPKKSLLRPWWALYFSPKTFISCVSHIFSHVYQLPAMSPGERNFFPLHESRSEWHLPWLRCALLYALIKSDSAYL